MAIIKGAIQMNGGIKGVSFYSLRGSDKVFMRTKGGATKDQIANSPKFEALRKQQKEFSGCAKFASLSRYAFGGLHRKPSVRYILHNKKPIKAIGTIGFMGLLLSSYYQTAFFFQRCGSSSSRF